MRKPPSKVVAFDLDDTLIPEVLFLKSGIRHIASFLNKLYPELPSQRIIGCMDAALVTRSNHYSALESLIKEYRLSDSVDMKKIVTKFRSHMPDPSIYHAAPFISGILNDLKQKDIPLALITDGRSLTQRNKIQAAGLYSFFDNSDILISEETGHDKFDPDNFLFIMKKYAGAKEFHYVGDNPRKDFLHPSRLGWKTHLAHPFPLAIHQGMPR
ncbi:MAG: HAD hydrolase-like protein [Muribaculaceae bacterium]|nr:HAD hydrolase-like protein [Muribaculaceae bacterium]